MNVLPNTNCGITHLISSFPHLLINSKKKKHHSVRVSSPMQEPNITSQLIQSGTLSLHLSICIPALTLSAVTSRSTISSRPFNSLSTYLLRLRLGFSWPMWPLCMFTNYIYLLTIRTVKYKSVCTDTLSPICWASERMLKSRTSLPLCSMHVRSSSVSSLFHHWSTWRLAAISSLTSTPPDVQSRLISYFHTKFQNILKSF